MKVSAKTSSLPMILLIVFIVLKLTNNVSWSWLWVLSPLWVLPAIAIIGYSFFGLLGYIINKIEKRKSKV